MLSVSADRFWPSEFRQLLLSIVIVTFASLADAQALSPSELPKVLKELPRAGSMCRRDAPEAAALLASGEEASEADLGCVRSPADVQAEWHPSTSVLFDLRSRAKYEQFHVEGAISSNEAELLAKPYWRDKNVVLMGGGTEDLQLAMVCGRLKRKGYRHVVVMQGGALGLVRDGASLRGVADRLSDLVRLTAPEAWYLGRQPQVLVLAGADRSEFLKGMRHARPLPAVHEQDLKKALSAYVSADKKTPRTPMAVVLLTSKELGDEALLKLQKTVSPTPLLIYPGSYADYTREIAKQNAVWKSHERGPKKTACLG